MMKKSEYFLDKSHDNVLKSQNYKIKKWKVNVYIIIMTYPGDIWVIKYLNRPL